MAPEPLYPRGTVYPPELVMDAEVKLKAFNSEKRGISMDSEKINYDQWTRAQWKEKSLMEWAHGNGPSVVGPTTALKHPYGAFISSQLCPSWRKSWCPKIQGERHLLGLLWHNVHDRKPPYPSQSQFRKKVQQSYIKGKVHWGKQTERRAWASVCVTIRSLTWNLTEIR